MKVGARILFVTVVAMAAAVSPRAVGPQHVDISWLSISNVYCEFESLRVLTDGYITRLPQAAFFGGGSGLSNTRQAFKPDVAAVQRVLDALGGPSSINVLLTGHSHVDHSFDTATWSKLTGARIIGSKTTCLQTMAQSIPEERCTPVYGGERIVLAEGVTLRVVRRNHSGDPATNPDQHNPAELDVVPRIDPQTGGLRAGVAEDFPNGGGNRGFLFVVDGPEGRFSWFLENSASEIDLGVPIVIAGVNYGAPLDNLKAALVAKGLESVDLWIGSRGVNVAQLVLPILKPKAYLPVHWDDVWRAFNAGVPQPYSNPALEAFLEKAGVQLVKPTQDMDKWRLDRSGIHSVPNTTVKRALGFS
jgi:L-ascorbate metabolism protein UlaG (beta-lactamase superfamily)